ncbi:MAG: hypothetical protein ABII90_12660 [Bacteroidota bacterium]
MKRKIILEKEIFGGSKAVLYTIRFVGSSKTETEKFFDQYNRQEDDLKSIATNIDLMLNRYGIRENIYRFEGDNANRNNLRCLPPQENEYGRKNKSRLRLYFWRFNEGVGIIGGGCFKPLQIKGKIIKKYQEVPTCEKAALILEKVSSAIIDKINEDVLEITDIEIAYDNIDDLTLEIEI